MTTTAATYRDGIATIITATRKTEVNVPVTADVFLDGPTLRPTKTDVVALSIGYRTLAAENKRLKDELTAARAGQLGKEHAMAMQEARVIIAGLNAAAEQFLGVYDEGNAPESDLDSALRDKITDAQSWLLNDVNDCMARQKILKGGV
jgi:hypothetical protein